MGSRRIRPLIPSLEGVSYQLHALINLSRGKEPGLPIEEEAGWALQPCDVLQKRQISCPCLESGHESVVTQPFDYLLYRISCPISSWCQNLFPSMSHWQHPALLTGGLITSSMPYRQAPGCLIRPTWFKTKVCVITGTASIIIIVVICTPVIKYRTY